MLSFIFLNLFLSNHPSNIQPRHANNLFETLSLHRQARLETFTFRFLTFICMILVSSQTSFHVLFEPWKIKMSVTVALFVFCIINRMWRYHTPKLYQCNIVYHALRFSIVHNIFQVQHRTPHSTIAISYATPSNTISCNTICLILTFC